MPLGFHAAHLRQEGAPHHRIFAVALPLGALIGRQARLDRDLVAVQPTEHGAARAQVKAHAMQHRGDLLAGPSLRLLRQRLQRLVLFLGPMAMRVSAW